MNHIKYFENFNSNKIIFLDIDGVLRPTNSWIGKDEYGELFVDNCIDNLKKILKETGADIVISSTWKSSGLLALKEMWQKRNLPGKIIDVTPNEVDVEGVEFYDMVDRGLEIDQWIKNNNFKGKYVIIDDVTDFSKEQLNFFIKTNPNIGLSEKDAEKCISILNI